MKNDDYGFYGKGLDGYVHYRQYAEAARNARMRPAAAGLSRRAENNRAAPKSDESGQISSGSCSIRCIRRA
ncbi:MAG: hypothetical protein ACLT4C_04630 [Butyricicoccus sp.]